jgi:methylated-DNA-[protein]-cysteine S-methyltransferase
MTSPDASGCTLFDTGIGPCGIAWKGGAIVGLQLPEPDPANTLVRLQRHTGSLPQVPLANAPAWVQHAAEGVQAIMRGEARDLCEVELDMRGVPDFQQRVYAIARRIPPGETRSYGDIADELGGKHLARAVGQALGLNPFAPIVPCHRVLAA